MVGFAGKKVKSEAGRPIWKIYALDPAKPGFEGYDASQRLSKDDAEEVYILHTDGGVFGYQGSFGAADFFANGGSRVQPGCHAFDDSFKDWITDIFKRGVTNAS